MTRCWAFALGLFLLALGLRGLAIAHFHIGGLYGQDAFAYFDCAHRLLQLHAAGPACGDFYWPLGYPLLAATFMYVTHTGQLGAQLSSVVAGAALAPLAFWLVLEVDLPGLGRTPRLHSAIAAGLIMAFSGALLIASSVIMSDAAALMWAMMAAALLLRWGRAAAAPGQWRWLLAAAAALGAAIVTRWVYAALLPAVVGYFALQTRTVAANAASAARLVPAAVAVLVLLLIVLPQILRLRRSGAVLSDYGWLGQWNLHNAIRTSFDNAEGHFVFRLPPLLFYAEPLVHPLYLFPLLCPALLYGIGLLRRSHALLLLGGWVVEVGVYLIGIPQENLRFGLALFPPIAVLTGIGACCLPARRGRWRPMPPWLLLVASLALAVPFTLRALDRLQSQIDAQLAAIRYLHSQLPANALVVTFELSSALDYYTPWRVVDLFAQSPQTLRHTVCGQQATYLYVDTDRLESQWSDRAPGRNFRWLRDRIGLERAGGQDRWSLYRVQPCSP